MRLALAFVKEWGILPLVVSLVALLSSLRAVSIARREHRWKATDRDEADARQKWCAAQTEKLTLYRATLFGAPDEIGISPDKIAWAKWGNDNGYFNLVNDYMGRPCIRMRRRP